MNTQPFESRKIISEVSGFTPIFDVVVDQYHDETIAAVFGAIWRFCQMEDGVCKASLETIGQAIGVDKATVMRHAKTLCADGYLKDLTEELRNRPHVYAETGKIVMKSRIDAVAQRNATVAQRNATVAQRNATVAESKLNKDIKKDSKDTERFSAIAQKLENLGTGTLNSMSADYINEWLPKHADEWIDAAIELARKNGAHRGAVKYVDTILVGWEANGYPKPRAERVASAKKQKVNFYEALGVQNG